MDYQSQLPNFCLMLANHWSYTGIGWQLGLESCAESLRDSLTMAHASPSVPVCINLDALAYELLAEHYPDLIERLRDAVETDALEIIGGSYAQPLGSMISGESNIRQIVVGLDTIRNAVGIDVETFLEEEEFSHPQLPQLLLGAGYRWASLSQCDTWGRDGNPLIDETVIWWEGKDGSRIAATPKNALHLHPPYITPDKEWLDTPAGKVALAHLRRKGVPLVVHWTEFGWETLTGQAMNKFQPDSFAPFAERLNVRYVTHRGYMNAFAGIAKEWPTTRLRMDDYSDRVLPWGIGGDQTRAFWRHLEARLLAAERLDALCRLMHVPFNRPTRELLEGWKGLLIGQSHDVALCEFSRWNGGVTPPSDPILDAHFLTWGAEAFCRMDAGKDAIEPVIQRSLTAIASAVPPAEPDGTQLVLINPSGFARSEITRARVKFQAPRPTSLQLSTESGEKLPMQTINTGRDSQGRIAWADLLLPPSPISSLDWLTFTVAEAPACSVPKTDLLIDKEGWLMENAWLRVDLDPVTGAAARITDKRSGAATLGGEDPFPTLRLRPGAGPHDRSWFGRTLELSATSKLTPARLEWTESGPLRATLKASVRISHLRMETCVSLGADQDHVDIRIRLMPFVPPAAFVRPEPPEYRIPREINDGYWVSFDAGFSVESIERDYPFAVEKCRNTRIDALNFIDLIGGEHGLLIIHGGTQCFELGQGPAGSRFENLILREWESTYTGEPGWPRVADYRYRLIPHATLLTAADRTRAVEAFDMPLMVTCKAIASNARAGHLNVAISQPGVTMSNLRRVDEHRLELRLVEWEGKEAVASVSLGAPVAAAWRTDLRGNTKERLEFDGSVIIVTLSPNEVCTLIVDLSE